MHLSFCMYGLYVVMHMHVCTYAHGAQRSVSGIFFPRGQSLLLTLDLTNSSRLVVIKPQGSFCLSLASAGDYEYAQVPSIYKLN